MQARRKEATAQALGSRAGKDGRTRQALRGRQVPGPGTHAGGLSGRRQRRSPHPLPEPQVQAEASPGFSLAVSRRPQGRVLGQRLGRGARGPPPVSERDPSPTSPPRAPGDPPPAAGPRTPRARRPPWAGAALRLGSGQIAQRRQRQVQEAKIMIPSTAAAFPTRSPVLRPTTDC